MRHKVMQFCLISAVKMWCNELLHMQLMTMNQVTNQFITPLYRLCKTVHLLCWLVSTQ